MEFLSIWYLSQGDGMVWSHDSFCNESYKTNVEWQNWFEQLDVLDQMKYHLSDHTLFNVVELKWGHLMIEGRKW